MNQTLHTPTPWKVETVHTNGGRIIDASGSYMAKLNCRPHVLATIVRYVNEREGLLRVVRSFRDYFMKHSTFGLNEEETAMLQEIDVVLADAEREETPR